MSNHNRQKINDAQLDRLFDIARNTNFALWAALLTVNSLFATIFTATVIFHDRYQLFALGMVVICFFNSAMLIKNFLDNKLHLKPIFDIYSMSDSDVLSMPEEELNKSIEQSASIHDKIEKREFWIIRLLLLQALSIIFLLTFKLIYHC